MKYRAFLSYSHADRKWARWLHRALESYRPPKKVQPTDGGSTPKRLAPIFRDRDELPSSASLSDAVQSALAQSEWLIVICSPSAAASQWVNEEIRASRSLGRSDRVLAFIVDGEPGAEEGRDCFPEALTQSLGPDEPHLEPVAADARRLGDGRGNAMLKIAAGMLGVGFDSLRQRDIRRRQQRLVAFASGSLIVAAITIILAISAVIARNEAQQRRAEAEDLIDFMLGDLRTQLHKIGRLDVFESVGNKALEYFSAQDDAEDNPGLLSQRAKNLRQIGVVRMEQGDLPGALLAFQESLKISERVAARAPEDPEVQIALANSRFYVGYVHWERAELEQASSIFESIIPLVDAVSASEPDNPKWLVERAYANTNLGRVFELEGRYGSALAAYQVVMEVNQRLTELEPDNPEWQLELGFAHNNLGKLLSEIGRLDEAEAHFRSDLELKRRLYLADPAHVVRRSYLAQSQYFVGKLLTARGGYAESESLLEDAVQHFVFLTELDPERQNWRHRRGNIEREFARLMGLTQRFEAGLALIGSSLEGFRDLVQGDPQKAEWGRELIRSLLVAAELNWLNGDSQTARQCLLEAQGQIDGLLDKEPSIVETQQLAAFVGLLQAHLSGSASASDYLQNVLERLDREFPTTANPQIIELRAETLTGLGDDEAAAELRAQLREIGYKGRLSMTYRAQG